MRKLINPDTEYQPPASATVVVGEPSRMVFSSQAAGGLGEQCSLCLNSAVDSVAQARARLPFCTGSKGLGSLDPGESGRQHADRRSLRGISQVPMALYFPPPLGSWNTG